ncbi:MAG: PilZ domain-containing protein [Proteobacteria bacterium]|nr:PilZ domain-containing protein [Pseudomonadota bacterium]
MDSKTKIEFLQFIRSEQEHVGDLATWIQSPQRRFHRHELFGVALAEVTLQESARAYKVRDLGYGGCGIVGGDQWVAEGLAPGVPFEATLTVLDRSENFTMVVRHTQNLHVGCEFANLSEVQKAFLKSFIQYMNAALQIRQAEPTAVFPEFEDKSWLNLVAHRGSIQFHIRRSESQQGFDAMLVFLMNGNHTFASWQDGSVEIGFLNREMSTDEDQNEMIRQIVSLLVGIRQGASMPDFSPVIEMVAALMKL